MRFLGKEVMIFAANYIWVGTLSDMTEHEYVLENPGIAYETGEFTAREYKDFQRLPGPFAIVKKTATEGIAFGKFEVEKLKAAK